MTASEILSQIQKLNAAGQRGAKVRKQIAALQWEYDHLTTGAEVNRRRVAAGLEPWPDFAA